jgi:hypothetical protein
MPSKVIFLYDELMTKEKQSLLRLPLKFLSYGYVRGKMYWLNDDKKRRYFVIPPQSEQHRSQWNTFVYGGIFVMNDFDEYERALYSYYNSSIPYVGEIMQEDLYYPKICTVTPIAFSTLQELEECRYQSLSDVDMLVMLANESNQKVQNSLKHGRYYRRNSGIDVPNFLTMVMENQNGTRHK